MWVEVRDKSELRIGSVVDLRVVDILVVDVRFDMDTILDLGLEVKAFKQAMYRCSSLGCRERVDLISQDYE